MGEHHDTVLIFSKSPATLPKTQSRKVCKKYKEQVQLLIIYGTTVTVHLGGYQSSCPLQRMRSGRKYAPSSDTYQKLRHRNYRRTDYIRCEWIERS
jgi:hypothetical protein